MLGLGNILSKGGAIQKFPNEYSFNFDGANDDLNIGTSSAPTGNFTISCWAYSTGQGTNPDNAIYYGSGLTAFIAINTTNNYVQTYIGGASGGAKTANSTITQNQWHHIAVTWDGSNTKIYIDGDDKSLSGNGAGNPGSASTYIGGKPSGDTNQFKGYLDEVAIWHTALDATAIGKISSKPVDLTKHSASNLKLWLRAGDKVQPESTTSIARADYSTEFDGSDDYIVLGGSSPDTAFSISAWVYDTHASGSDYSAIYASNSTAIWFGVHNNSNGKVRLHINGDGNYADTPSGSFSSPSNQWIHLVGTWDGTNAKIYINGVSQTLSVTGTLANPTANANPTIGTNDNSVGLNQWTGSMSNVAIFKTALPANDIALMAKSRFTPTRDYMLKQVDFDGGNDYIDCGASNSIITGTNITLSCWFKSSDTDDSKLMQLKRAATSSNLSIDINQQGNAGHVGAVVRHSSGGSYLTTNGVDGSVDDGAWHHIALTTTSSAQVLYLDGVQVDTGTVALVEEFSSDPFTIGALNGSNYVFGGSIVGVAVYSETKDANFIKAQYDKGLFADWSADTNLSGYWRMGNGTGDVYPTIVDQSSNSNNGTITNGASDDIVENMVAGYDLGSFRGSEELGGELVGDSSFTVDNTDNITGTGTHANVTGGALVFVDPVAPATGQTDIIFKNSGEQILVSGRMYKHIFTIADSSGSGARLKFDWITGHDHANYTDGTHTIYGLASQVSADMDISGASPSFKMTDMSIKEVLSSAVDDTKNSVIDVSNPVLGGEVNNLANALSPTNEANATTGLTSSDSNITSVSSPTYSGSYSIKFETDGNGEAMSFNPNLTLENGKFYKLSITYKTDSVNDEMRFKLGTGNNDGTYFDVYPIAGSTDWVTLNYYFLTSSTTFDMTIIENVSSPSEITAYIDNISIKKIQGNVGKPTSMDATNFPYTSVLPDQSFLTGVNSAYNYLDFDGSDAKVDLGTPSSLIIPSGTYAVWAYLDNDSSNTLYGRYDSDTAYDIRWMTLVGNKITLAINGGWKDASSTFTPNQWNHFAITVDADATITYVNGIATNTTSGVTIGTNTVETNSIGWHGLSGNYFNGKMAHFGIWNKALSGTDISAIHKAGRHSNLLDSYSDNLVGYYAFGGLDAVTGLADTDSTIYDRSGNGNHGTTSGTASGDLKSPPNAQPEGYDIESTTRTTTIP